jgi:hypothetical protein
VSHHAASLVKAALACAVVAAVAAAVPARAQNTQEEYRPTGTRIISQTEAADPDMGRRLLRLTSACVNRRYDSEVVSLLRNGNPEVVAYAAEGIRDRDNQSPLALSECLLEALNGAQVSTQMRIPERSLRLALAEGAYLRRHAGPLAIAAGSPQFIAGRAVLLGSSPEQSQAMGQFADCLVFHAPEQADRLVRGAVGGDEETANARALAPAIGECLPQGQQIDFTTGALRDYAIDGLWARSEALAAQGAGQ